ncbi:DUF2829 domain-containing protein [Bacillus mycoides]|nr:DUF2829 domain-containing protein [Bacillus mycoides]
MNELMKGKKVTRVVLGGYAPAQPYQADMFANDWIVVE